MNCRDLDHLVANRPFASLGEAERREGEAHATACRHCAPTWVAYARLATVRVPPMPAELAARCRALAATHTQRSVLRFVPRGAVLAAGGLLVLAAAAGVITTHLINASAPPRVDSAEAPMQVAAKVPAPPAITPDTPTIQHDDQGENEMTKSKSIAAAIALGAAAAAAQAPAQAEEPRVKTAEEIIAANDVNGDGIVTLEEAAKVNGNLYVMFSAVYDQDHDGRLDVAELKRGMGEVEVGTALVKITGESGGNMAAARPETIMANNDLNKDGIITREEAKTAGKALARMWDSYDLNKDGKVEYAELAKAQGY
jgi:hypothetical protein